MRLKVIACNVLTREVSWCAARSSNTLDLVFLPKGEHDHPPRLREILQEEIDATAISGIAYDAVVLVYGICGNATIGLKANTFPLVMPRAHDCTTLFLGSKEGFEEHFGKNPSQAWTSVGYSERGDSFLSDGNTRTYDQNGFSFAELAATYGEENACYLMEAMTAHHDSPEVPFLDVPETHVPELVEKIKTYIADTGKRMRTIPGGIRLIEALVAGHWDESLFLVTPPGSVVAGVYDYEQVVCAKSPPNP